MPIKCAVYQNVYEVTFTLKMYKDIHTYVLLLRRRILLLIALSLINIFKNIYWNLNFKKVKYQPIKKRIYITI